MAPSKGVTIPWANLVDVSSNILTRVIFTQSLSPELTDLQNIILIEQLVGELLQTATFNLGHAVGPKDLRVEHTYVVKIKDHQPKNVRMVVHLFTDRGIKAIEAIPLLGQNQAATPSGALLHLSWPDRPRTEAFLISNVPSNIHLEALSEELTKSWDLDREGGWPR